MRALSSCSRSRPASWKRFLHPQPPSARLPPTWRALRVRPDRRSPVGPHAAGCSPSTPAGIGAASGLPADVSRDAAVADAVFVVEQFRLQPVVVVGQSVGGLTALSLAARWPELVRGLVLVDASPSGGGEVVEEAVSAAARALREWPASFGSRSDAQAFFAERFGAGLAVEAWTSGLERVENGWQPRFDVVVMAQTFARRYLHPELGGVGQPHVSDTGRSSRKRHGRARDREGDDWTSLKGAVGRDS